MELGALVCLPNGAPQCDKCPLSAQCAAHLQEKTHCIPVKAATKSRRVEQRVVCLIFYDNKVALRQRPGRGLLASLWEYPNYLKGEGGLPWPLSVEHMDSAGTGKHIFTHIEWQMKGYLAEVDGEGPEDFRWVDAQGFDALAIPTAFKKYTGLTPDQYRKKHMGQ
jgi:A/G-specific adenine glycosylase